jgi:HJR/Mrr/RecB family endonuclease
MAKVVSIFILPLKKTGRKEKRKLKPKQPQIQTSKPFQVVKPDLTFQKQKHRSLLFPSDALLLPPQ